MQKFSLLVLTDHSGHSSENSLYSLAREMQRHPRCARMDVASRGNNLNDFFFKKLLGKALFVNKVDENFFYRPDGQFFKEYYRRELLENYDVVWLRIPPPLPAEFLGFLTDAFPNQLIINNPSGIYETGSKAFLMNFPELCPPMKICRSIEDIIDFKNQFPIVLKPFREYGGKGIVRIEGEKVWIGKRETTFQDFAKDLKKEKIEYLAVKFLKNVSQGDKRIVVVSGKIMGASLRLPQEGSWICNVAMGGRSGHAEADEDEIRIIERIHPQLHKMGVLMYGVDTLVGDDGRRVLSEINTTSIGGLPQIAKLKGEPLVEEAINLIWNYIVEKKRSLTNSKV